MHVAALLAEGTAALTVAIYGKDSAAVPSVSVAVAVPFAIKASRRRCCGRGSSPLISPVPVPFSQSPPCYWEINEEGRTRAAPVNCRRGKSNRCCGHGRHPHCGCDGGGQGQGHP